MTPRAPGSRLVHACAAVAVLAICGLVGSMDYEDALLAEALYCSEVREWNESGGNSGHPDYDGIAADVCFPGQPAEARPSPDPALSASAFDRTDTAPEPRPDGGRMDRQVSENAGRPGGGKDAKPGRLFLGAGND